MNRMQDHERVLGQMARGEVLAGPEAARRIAARHEAAYGDVWKRPAPAAPVRSVAVDSVWADAVHSLTDDETAGGVAT
ncbi:hypothetical protein [Streptomyces milbemycinicus]|uniref:hypothetical protein n=1 Tax=Streptomyces milbemycinicus TaxID=476552 RepID=UPI001B80563D|nr:hypothetical protein [Streptomyces milbemycinicus]